MFSNIIFVLFVVSFFRKAIWSNKTSWLLDNDCTTTESQTIQNQNYIRKTDRPTDLIIWMWEWHAKTLRPEQRMTVREACSANLINEHAVKKRMYFHKHNHNHNHNELRWTERNKKMFFDVCFSLLQAFTHKHTLSITIILLYRVQKCLIWAILSDEHTQIHVCVHAST